MFLLFTGCDGQKISNGSVSGQIAYQGKPLSSGIVLFYPENGPAVSGVIADGHYQIDHLSLGRAKIMIWPAPPNPCLGARPVYGRFDPNNKEFNHPLPPAHLLPEGVDPRIFDPRYQLRNVTYMQIPQKYQDPSTSGLTIEMQNARQTHDIDLQ